MTATQPGQASSDIPCAALFVAAIALLLWSDLRPAPVAVAGLAAGMALSTKITIAAALAVLFVGVVVILLRQQRRLSASLWSLAFVTTGSFWFIRDWVLSGNPLPWLDLRLGPIHFERQVAKSTAPLADDILDPHAWRALYLDGVWQGLGRVWPVIVLAAAGVIVALVTRRSSRASQVTRLIGVVLAAGVFGWVFTPLTGGFGFVYNLRYLSPILLVAFASVAMLVPPAARVRAVVLSACAVLVVVDATMPNRELVAAWPTGEVLPALLVVLLAVAAICSVLLRGRVALAVIALALVTGLWFAQRHYLDHRYVADRLEPQSVDAFFRDVHDARVVVFGGDSRFTMFGVDLSNEVGRGDLPPPQFDATSCRAWRTYLGGSADYLVMLTDQFGFFVSPPVSTVADDPAAHVVLRSDHATIYQLSGPLDPSTC